MAFNPNKYHGKGFTPLTNCRTGRKCKSPQPEAASSSSLSMGSVAGAACALLALGLVTRMVRRRRAAAQYATLTSHDLE